MTSTWFVAWPVTGATEWLAGLESQAPGGLRFTTPDDLHVTLAFLDRFNPALVKKMTSLLKGLPLKTVGSLAPDRLVALPQPRRFSALSFNFADGRFEVEAQITKWRDRLCREAGAKIESRPVFPHVTIARPERRIGEADRDAALEWADQLPSQSALKLQLERPCIYAMATGESGNRYERIG